MPGGTASAKALKQEYTSYGEDRGIRSQRRDGNGGGAAYTDLTGDCNNLPGLSLGVV